MKKILLIANTDWYLFRFRLSLARTIREYGLEPIFVSPPGRYVSDIQESGFRWIKWNIDRRTYFPINEIASIYKLVQILNREEPVLIHNHTIKPVFYGSLSARLIGYKKVVNSITGRGYLFMGKSFPLKMTRKIVVPFYRKITNHSSYVTIFENQDDLEFFRSYQMFIRTLNVVIPGVGVDPDIFSPSPEPDGVPVVAYVGRLLWDKGVGTFVQASQLLKKQKAAIRMVLIGAPDPGNPTNIPEKVIHQWVQDGLVEWWGWQENMHTAYRQCNVIVIPSLGEGLSTTLLEAMASGRAVIATDVPGCRDIIKDKGTGLLVPPKDSIALADAIQHLANSPYLRSQFAQAGRALIEKQYTTQYINQLTIQTYKEILSN